MEKGMCFHMDARSSMLKFFLARKGILCFFYNGLCGNFDA